LQYAIEISFGLFSEFIVGVQNVMVTLQICGSSKHKWNANSGKVGSGWCLGYMCAKEAEEQSPPHSLKLFLNHWHHRLPWGTVTTII